MTTGKKVLIGCLIALGVFVLGVIGIVALALFATSGINDVANNQLKALRAGDVNKAYSLTSKDFQAATSLDQFKAFVDQYPALKNNESSNFSSRNIENDQGTLEGSLRAKDGGVTPVTYKLVKENDEWKILSILLNPTGAQVKDEKSETGTDKEEQQPTEAKSTNIFDVRLNEKADKDGVVSVAKNEYKSDTAEILVSAYIEAATKGMDVSALLTYVPTGDTVGPANNTVGQDGDIISNFSFTKPTKGWPVGEYKITIKLSTGETKDAAFTVK